MAKLPRPPRAWNDQSAATSQEAPPSGPDFDNWSGGLLGGLQTPGWNLENSGLGLLLHPQTIAQINFGQESHAAQPMAARTTGNPITVASLAPERDNYSSAAFMEFPGVPLSSALLRAKADAQNKSAAPPAAARSAPKDGLALDANGNVMVEQVQVTPRVNTQRLAQILGIGEGNYESYNTGTRGVPGGGVGHSFLNRPPGTVTGRTINQILNTETLPGSDPNRMFAVGAYQITIPTLKEAVRALKLKGDEQLTPELQDRIFSEFLIPKAGGGALGNLLNRGEGTVDQAQHAAAREWASVAVPAGYPIRDRRISDGTMSYYAGPANRANMDSTQALREFLTDLAR